MKNDFSNNSAKKNPQVAAALAACSGAFALGTGMSWSSPALPSIALNSDGQCADADGNCYWGDPDQALTQEEASWVAGLFSIGCVMSSLVTGYLLATFGRKWTMMGMATPFVAGWIILTMAGPVEMTSPWWFYTGRLLIGFGGGSYALAAPIYVSETSEASVRGALGSLMHFMITLGILFSNAVGAMVGWDVLSGICILFPILLAVAMSFMPESPHFLIESGQQEEAKRALQWLRGSRHDVDAELKEIAATSTNQEGVSDEKL